MTDPVKPFVGAFDYASQGQTLEARVGPFRLVATLWDDDDSSAPWERDDGHGPVSDWRPDHSKRPGERELAHDHGSSRFYDFAEAVKLAKRDGWGFLPGPLSLVQNSGGLWAAWYGDGHNPTGVQPGFADKNAAVAALYAAHKATYASPAAYAAAAAEHDFKVLQAWCNDEWRYYGVAVRVFLIDGEGDDTPLTDEYQNALWGVEGDYPGSDNSYLVEVANDLAPEALAAAREALTKLAGFSAAALALVEAEA